MAIPSPATTPLTPVGISVNASSTIADTVGPVTKLLTSGIDADTVCNSLFVARLETSGISETRA